MSKNTQTRITITNLKVARSLSEETMAFTCDVHFDGKKVGYAKNDGQGGMTFCSPYPGMGAAFRKAEEFADTIPVLKSDGTQDKDHEGKLAFEGIDGVVDSLAYQQDIERLVRASINRWYKKQTKFGHGGKWWTIKLPYDAKLKARIEAEYPGAEILNEKSVDELVQRDLAIIEAESKAEAARWEAKADKLVADRMKNAEAGTNGG